MLIIGLMVIALICLAVGLALPSSAWLIASLIATAGAGYLVWKMRSAIAPAPVGASKTGGRLRRPGAGRTAGRVDPVDAPDSADEPVDDYRADDYDADDYADSNGADDYRTADYRADDHADWATAAPTVAHDQTQRIATIDAPIRDDDETQLIPAVTATTTTAATSVAAAPDIQAGPDDVWVIDGRPRYHLGNCPIIQGQDAEPIPFDQAVEDGFMPCSLCEPENVRR